MSDVTIDNYFELRRVSPDFYKNFTMPEYMKRRLPADKAALIIDFGCGLGQVLRELLKLGYTNSIGIEINEQAIAHCLSNGMKVFRSLDDIGDAKAAFVIMSHVLEHLPKTRMRAVLQDIWEHLSPEGCLLICVPNAQSVTGPYWAYEDFTHEYLFTSGSLYYVTRLAGFRDVTFIDIDCTEGLGPLAKASRKAFLWLYRSNIRFWKLVTASYYHYSSEEIFSYEIKALCRKG